MVSLIFVFNCVVSRPRSRQESAHSPAAPQGFVSGAAANVWLTDRLGFGKVGGSM